VALLAEYSKYELMPIQRVGAVAAIKARSGALLRFTWPNGYTGHADLFPWPELGDPPLDEHLMGFMKGQITALMEQSIWLAKRDAGWRATGVNPYKQGARAKNYHLITDFEAVEDLEINRAKTAGFTSFKIKLGRDVDAEAKWLDKFIKKFGVLVRLDFNAKLSIDRLERFLSHLDVGPKARIEYVEDPFPWNAEEWTDASKLVPLAADSVLSQVPRESDQPPPFKFVIVKPARFDVDKAVHFVDRYGLKMAVTHSLDHPVGQMHAVILAAELKKKYPNRLVDCGCNPAKIYELNAFNSLIEVKGPFIEGVSGLGIGFDGLLKDLTWVKLRG
jgi:O-succinylbenzoate synthase